MPKFILWYGGNLYPKIRLDLRALNFEGQFSEFSNKDQLDFISP